MSIDTLEIVDISDDRAILICDEKHNDVAEIHHDAYSTSGFSFVDAVRAAHMFVAASDLASTLEALVDAVTNDREARQQFASQLAAAETVLRRAYGATNA